MLNQFLDELVHLLGSTIIAKNIDYESNVSEIERSVGAILRPKSSTEVQTIVQTARKYKVNLSSISRGKNWGFGSKLPSIDGGVIIDLSEMSKIHEVNLKYGFVTIEPGVTQIQLYQELERLNASYYIDVTGSSADSSIIGNTLERGIAYNTQRAEHLVSLEVVLGTGDIYNTGTANTKKSKIADLYKFPVGLDFKNVFLQSGLGIVTKATIKLLPKPDFRETFIVRIEEKSLPQSIELFSKLMSQNILKCIPHIADKNRLLPVIAPLLSLEYQKQGLQLSKMQIEDILRRYIKGEWNAIGSISGSKNEIKRAKRELKKNLKGIGTVQFSNLKKIKFLTQIARFFRFREALNVISATEPLRDLPSGRPTDKTLYSLHWPHISSLSREAAHDPDHSSSGFIFCCPFAPLSGENATLLLSTAKKHCEQFNFDPGITLNLISPEIVEAVISIGFNRKNKDETNRAHTCMKSLYGFYFDNGLLPYRIPVGYSDLVPVSDIHQYLSQGLKNIMDPDNIIASKYDNIGRSPVVKKIAA